MTMALPFTVTHPQYGPLSGFMAATLLLREIPAKGSLRLRTAGDVRAWLAHPGLECPLKGMTMWLSDPRLTPAEQVAVAERVLQRFAPSPTPHFLLSLTELVQTGRLAPSPALYEMMAACFLRITAPHRRGPQAPDDEPPHWTNAIQMMEHVHRAYHDALTNTPRVGEVAYRGTYAWAHAAHCFADAALARVVPPQVFTDTAWPERTAGPPVQDIDASPDAIARALRFQASLQPTGPRWVRFRDRLRETSTQVVAWLSAGAPAVPGEAKGAFADIGHRGMPMAISALETPWDSLRPAPDTQIAPWILPPGSRHWTVVAPHAVGFLGTSMGGLDAFFPTPDDAWDVLRHPALFPDAESYIALASHCAATDILHPVTPAHAAHVEWLSDELRRARTSSFAQALTGLLVVLAEHLPSPPITIAHALAAAAHRWPSRKPPAGVLGAMPCTPATAGTWWAYAATISDERALAFAMFQAALTAPEGRLALPDDATLATVLAQMPLALRAQVTTAVMQQRGAIAFQDLAPQPAPLPRRAR